MDAAAIPFAVRIPDCIKQAIVNGKVLIALIGARWQHHEIEPDNHYSI
jgi:hypothetical protein